MQATPERNTREIIAELINIGRTALTASLIVAFPNSTTYVQHTDERALEDLAAAIRNGGKPVGYIVVRKTEGGELELQAFPLREYAENERLKEYILAIAREMIAAMEGGGHAPD
jgi:hypothetical protein